jgi:hypothetical protein
MQVPSSFLDRIRANDLDSVCKDETWGTYKNIVFSWVCGHTNETTVRYFLEKGGVDPAYKYDWPLYNACQNGNVEIVKILLTYESVRTHASANKNRSRISAECNEYMEIVDLLLQVPNVCEGPSITKSFYGFEYV